MCADGDIPAPVLAREDWGVHGEIYPSYSPGIRMKVTLEDLPIQRKKHEKEQGS
jgi:hypothetical protein